MIRKEILIFGICVFIALVLWIIHQLNQTYIRQYHLNAVIVDLPKSYEQDSIVVPMKITVKGSGLKIILLESYYPEKIAISFKKLKRVNKKGLFLIKQESISENEQLPVKIKVLEVQPDTVRIKFSTQNIKKKK